MTFFHCHDAIDDVTGWPESCPLYLCLGGVMSGSRMQGQYLVNTLRPRRNEQHFADDIFKRIFFNENVWISITISLKFVPNGPINNISALVQIIAWRRSGDKPLSEPMMVSLPTHICVTRPQWVNKCKYFRRLSRFYRHTEDLNK